MKLDPIKINSLLADKMMSKQELARKANISNATIYAVLGGKSCNTVTAGKIARVLNVSTIEIAERS